jgi:hypothetical protein
MALLAVEIVDGFDDGLVQGVEGLDMVVVNRRTGEVGPELLDKVGVRCRRWVPDDRYWVSRK